MGTKGADTETAKGRWPGDQTTRGTNEREQKEDGKQEAGEDEAGRTTQRVTQVGGDRQADRRRHTIRQYCAAGLPWGSAVVRLYRLHCRGCKLIPGQRLRPHKMRGIAKKKKELRRHIQLRGFLVVERERAEQWEKHSTQDTSQGTHAGAAGVSSGWAWSGAQVVRSHTQCSARRQAERSPA